MACHTHYNPSSAKVYLITATLLGLFTSPTYALPRINSLLLTRESRGLDGDAPTAGANTSSEGTQLFTKTTRMIIGALVGCFTVIILTTVGVFLWRRSRSKRKQREMESRQSQSLILQRTPSSLSSDTAPEHYDYPDNVRLVGGRDGDGYPEMNEGFERGRWAGAQYNGSYFHS